MPSSSPTTNSRVGGPGGDPGRGPVRRRNRRVLAGRRPRWPRRGDRRGSPARPTRGPSGGQHGPRPRQGHETGQEIAGFVHALTTGRLSGQPWTASSTDRKRPHDPDAPAGRRRAHERVAASLEHGRRRPRRRPGRHGLPCGGTRLAVRREGGRARRRARLRRRGARPRCRGRAHQPGGRGASCVVVDDVQTAFGRLARGVVDRATSSRSSP